MYKEKLAMYYNLLKINKEMDMKYSLKRQFFNLLINLCVIY